MRSEAAIQRRANGLLDDAGISEPPVKLTAIVDNLGAKIQPEIIEDAISGALDRRGPQPIIGVNAQHPSHRQRFTIAHEIGHLILHKDADQFVDRVFRRDPVSSDASDPTEIEANRFAAALLMPKKFLLAEPECKRGPLSSDNVEELSRRYGVSQQAMTFRLVNLGLPLEVS